MILAGERQVRQLLMALQSQREKFQRLVVQMCDTTNELNQQQDTIKEKEDELQELRKKLEASANMGSVGMKLGKRLQTMLVENKELRRAKGEYDAVVKEKVGGHRE